MLFAKEMSLARLYSIIIICVTLTGCGGGGNKSSNSTTQPTPILTFSLSTTDVTLAENATTDITLSANNNGKEQISYSAQLIEGNDASVSISVTNNILTLTANDVSANTSLKINITASAANLSKTVPLTLNVTNTPATTYRLKLADEAQSQIVLAERKSLSINLFENTDSSQSAHYTFSTEPVISTINASIVNHVLTVAIGELENDVTTTLTATGSIDGLSDTFEISLVLSNTSGESLREKVDSWLGDNAVQFNDLIHVAPSYAQMAYLSGGINASEKQQVIADFNAAVAHAKAIATSNTHHSLVEASANYQAAIITESEFSQAFELYRATLQAASSQIITALNAITKHTNHLPFLPDGPYEYVTQYQAFSAVIGHNQLGRFEDNNWIFSEQYQLLNQLVPVLGTPSHCLAE